MVYVVVTMTIKDGCMEESLELCGRLRPLVLAERGCIGYDYVRENASLLSIQEAVDRNRITLIERWESPEALAAHGASPHMKALGPKMAELRSGVTARAGEAIF
ncbi:MAG: antibiotic biosynthesis monooxygenase [Treponema sp.]|nr:antibiotic biosynthesis monooxygenase [Treponema sp.]